MPTYGVINDSRNTIELAKQLRKQNVYTFSQRLQVFSKLQD